MASSEELSTFLASVERRAFKQAQFAVRDADGALDIVQDAMLKLSENYGDRPAAELPLLFTRILQNTIHDYFRRQKVRSTWITLFSALGGGGTTRKIRIRSRPSRRSPGPTVPRAPPTRSSGRR